MKPIFKMTALAALVVSVAACSSDKSDTVVAPKPANNQTQTDQSKADADKAKADADKAKEAEDAAKAKEAEAAAKAKEAEAAAKAAKEAEDAAKAKEAEAAAKAKEAEKQANAWRGEARTNRANIVNPSTGKSYTITVSAPSRYKEGYDGTTDREPVNNWSNDGYKLDYYQLSVEDKENSKLLDWHKGEIKSAGINGSEISKRNDKNEIVERTYPEKVDYLFKNTPYTTYGAVYNNYASKLFATYEKAASLSNNEESTYKIGGYEVIDGNQTNKIKYNDAVKGAATYTGEVLAHYAIAQTNDTFTNANREEYEKSPELDGSITINANFGTRAEESYATATLDSKVLGKVEFEKARMGLYDSGITFNTSSDTKINSRPVTLYSTVVGKDANEMVGALEYRVQHNAKQKGDVTFYDAVFAAEKQAK